MELDDYRRLLGTIYGDRAWIVAIDVLAAATPIVRDLKSLGAKSCLCVAASEGAGKKPDTENASIVLGVRAADMMSGIRASLDAFAELPRDAIERIDAFDPIREARVIGSLFDDGRPVAGRLKYGARPAAWQALEDKTSIDAFWDEAGVARAPSRVVAAEVHALREASRALDWGDGVAWAGDNREGFNGGAAYVRWVRTDADADSAARFFAEHCDSVRVMPFLEGIPCSIHGIVFDDYTVVLRPCEMFVFRRPGTNELHYGRAGSFWDPPHADRAEMREIARRSGDRLRATLGYRGTFTIDGVLTTRGFLPTELNPRFGAALGGMLGTLDLPVYLLHLAVVEGEAKDFQPRALERLLLAHLDSERSGRGLALTAKRDVPPREARLRWDDGGFRLAADDETPHDAVVMIGPAPTGTFVSVDLIAERTPVGPSAAPRVIAALVCADAHFDLGIGPLEPAREVSCNRGASS